MKIFMKILTSMVGVIVAANGILFMFKPELVLEHSAITPNGTFGLSTVRGLIGGSILASGFMVLFALIKGRPQLLFPVIVVLLGWTFGRLVGIVLDGFDPATFFGGILISFAMATVLFFAYRLLMDSQGNS